MVYYKCICRRRKIYPIDFLHEDRTKAGHIWHLPFSADPFSWHMDKKNEDGNLKKNYQAWNEDSIERQKESKWQIHGKTRFEPIWAGWASTLDTSVQRVNEGQRWIMQNYKDPDDYINRPPNLHPINPYDELGQPVTPAPEIPKKYAIKRPKGPQGQIPPSKRISLEHCTKEECPDEDFKPVLPSTEETDKQPEPMDVDDDRYKIRGQRPSQKGKGATNDQNASVDQKPPVEQQGPSGESEEAMVIIRGMEQQHEHLANKVWELKPKGKEHSEKGLVGQVSVGLAPDRNFISAPGHLTLRFEKVVRNVCLKNWGVSFSGSTQSPALAGGTAVATINPFSHFQNLNASLIHLDDNSMALSARDKDYLDSLPIRRMHVKGGSMSFDGLRILENVVGNTGMLKYQQSTPMQGIDRKIQWEMFDRERDFCWQSAIKSENGTEDGPLDENQNNTLGAGATRKFIKFDTDLLSSHPF